MSRFQNIGDDLLDLILNQQQLNQNLLAGVSKTVSGHVEVRANKLVELKITAYDNELYLFEELCVYIPKYNETTIYHNNCEWYIPL